MTDLDHEYTDCPVCPHCGYPHYDTTDFMEDCESPRETECYRCDKPFVMHASISISWTTKKVQP